MRAPEDNSRDTSISRLDEILILETSGTSGEPNAVPFTLRRLAESD